MFWLTLEMNWNRFGIELHSQNANDNKKINFEETSVLKIDFERGFWLGKNLKVYKKTKKSSGRRMNLFLCSFHLKIDSKSFNTNTILIPYNYWLYIYSGYLRLWDNADQNQTKFDFIVQRSHTISQKCLTEWEKDWKMAQLRSKTKKKIGKD